MALGKTVLSSGPGTSGHAYATDGKSNTRVQTDALLVVDLGALYTVFGARIVWEGAYAKEYTIDGSADKQSYSVLTHQGTPSVDRPGTTGPDSVLLNDTAHGYRYIRVRMRRGVYGGMSIWEFEVFGTPGAYARMHACTHSC